MQKESITRNKNFFTLRFKFEKETPENSLNEGNRLMEECETLVSFHHVESNHDISYDGLPTMVDGKVQLLHTYLF